MYGESYISAHIDAASPPPRNVMPSTQEEEHHEQKVKEREDIRRLQDKEHEDEVRIQALEDRVIELEKKFVPKVDWASSLQVCKIVDARHDVGTTVFYDST